MHTPEQPLDILITGGMLLTMEAEAGIIADPLIGIRDGKILFATARPSFPEFTSATRDTIDASGADVRMSIIGGRIVMRDRRLLTLDVEDVMVEGRKIAATIVAAGCYRSPASCN